MGVRKILDIDDLRKTFRIIDGKIERFDHRFGKNNQQWKKVINKANTRAGYCQVAINRSNYMYHYLLWILYYNENIPKGLEIDHINGNKIDNTIDNLRIVTHRENCQNTHRSGKVKGTSFRHGKNVYCSRIYINGKSIFLGEYKTEHIGNKIYKIACDHIEEYSDNKSFRNMIRKELIKELGDL
ncbi:MAG: HNH endonuclease [Candidatus Brocadiales bacterium]|nr:HNH endonuclease [Candidatus Brocadiales bacterium]